MTDYDALCRQLRALVIMDEVQSDNPLGREAADAIAALEAALQRLASPTQFCPGDPVAEVKARCEYAEKALTPAPAPAHLNKDGPCDKGAPGAYEVTDPAPAPKGKSWMADLFDFAARHPEPGDKE